MWLINPPSTGVSTKVCNQFVNKWKERKKKAYKIRSGRTCKNKEADVIIDEINNYSDDISEGSEDSDTEEDHGSNQAENSNLKTTTVTTQPYSRALERLRSYNIMGSDDFGLGPQTLENESSISARSHKRVNREVYYGNIFRKWTKW